MIAPKEFRTSFFHVVVERFYNESTPDEDRVFAGGGSMSLYDAIGWVRNHQQEALARRFMVNNRVYNGPNADYIYTLAPADSRVDVVVQEMHAAGDEESIPSMLTWATFPTMGFYYVSVHRDEEDGKWRADLHKERHIISWSEIDEGHTHAPGWTGTIRRAFDYPTRQNQRQAREEAAATAAEADRHAAYSLEARARLTTK